MLKRCATAFLLAVGLGGGCLLTAPSALAVEEHLKEVDARHDPSQEVAKGKRVIFLPIPMSNPTLGTGLGLASMFLYRTGEKQPISNTTLGGFYTNSDSWMVGAKQTTYLKEDTYRLTGGLAYYDLNLDFYGIGNEAGSQGKSIPINQTGVFLAPEFLRRFGDHLFLGLRYRYLRMDTSLEEDDSTDDGSDSPIADFISEAELEQVTSGLGVVIDYDSRDSQFYPHRGTLLDFETNFATTALGSDDTYQFYHLAYNRYHEVAENMVFAFQAAGCYTDGDVPYYDLCLFGSHNILRGYVGGQYRDRTLLATQLEYRWQFYKAFGMVLFGGIGEVAPSFSEYTSDNILPSYGAGVRYMLDEKRRINLSVDFAGGKDSDAVYFRIGEAF